MVPLASEIEREPDCQKRVRKEKKKNWTEMEKRKRKKKGIEKRKRRSDDQYRVQWTEEGKSIG